MYELLKAYEGIGKRIFEVEELKQILGVEEKYAKYANFKSRILLKAQEDIQKHTDIRFTFEELSDYGRRVERIAFIIHKNKQQSELQTAKAHENLGNKALECDRTREEEIRGFWVSKATMQSQVLAYYEKDFIIQTLKYCKGYFKHTTVKQKGGFFLKALQEGYFKEEIQKDSKKEHKKIKSIEIQEIQTQEKAKMTLERNQKIEKLRAEYLTDEFIEAVLAEHQGGFLYWIMENARKQGKVNKFLQQYVDRKLMEEFGEVYVTI